MIYENNETVSEALKNTIDAELERIIKNEERRQRSSLSLVASCSLAHPSIKTYESSVASNVTAEGYPGERYHAGCKHIDEIERLAVERCKSLFGAKHVNVQPLSASIANQAVIGMLVPPGGTIMGLALDAGGHLSHGYKANLSGKHYNSVEFGLGVDGRIDMEGLHSAAKECRPDLIIFGTTAYPRTLDFKKLREIADDVGAYLLADITHIAGLVISGFHPNPIEYAHVVTTCTHKQMYGPRGGLIMVGSDANERLKNSNTTLAKAVDRGIFPFIQGAPNNNMVAAKARIFSVCKSEEFSQICQNITRYADYMAKGFMEKGLKVPFEGTDNHIVLLDVWQSFGVTGLQAQVALEACNIIVNKNILPNDCKSVKDGSGIRIGSNSLALRHLDSEGLAFCVDIIVRVLQELSKSTTLSDNYIEKTQHEVAAFCKAYPIRESWSVS